MSLIFKIAALLFSSLLTGESPCGITCFCLLAAHSECRKINNNEFTRKSEKGEVTLYQLFQTERQRTVESRKILDAICKVGVQK